MAESKQLEQHTGERTDCPALLQVKLILRCFTWLQADALLAYVKDSIVVLEEVQSQCKEILVPLIRHYFERTDARLVANVTGWWNFVSDPIDGERQYWHLCVGAILKAWERLKAKVVRERVGDVSLIFDEFYKLLELFLRH